MKPSLSLFVSMQLLFLLSLFHFTVANFSSSKLPLCQGEERSALLRFKESFIINKSASDDPSAYPKVESWKPEGGSDDCCSWDGIECDEDTGHVIGLDLTSSCLYGSINSRSSLFRLVHLEWLSLADNDFNYSEIPSGFGNLSRLSHLDLSFSVFSGQIPSEIVELSKLATLDLTNNFLKLQKPGLRSLAEKLTNLKELRLSGVKIFSTVPHILANLSSLTSLLLKDCGLRGDFPTGIFHLPNLQSLSVRFNPYLTGYLPEFPRRSPLEDLRLAGTSFSGELPDSIGNLTKLSYLDLSSNNFSGPTPSSLGKLSKLSYLDLSSNNFSGPIPSSLGKLTKLSYLDLSLNSFSGPIPSSLGKLTKLSILGLFDNNFSGPIPSSLGKLTKLSILGLSDNNFSGPIPSSLGKLTKLSILDLSSNNFSEPIPSSLGKLNKLSTLDLSTNNFSEQIPSSLVNLTQLTQLFLSDNKLTGQIPSWLGNLNKLSSLDLSTNNFSDQIPSSLINLTQLTQLDLYENKLTGQIPYWIGNLTQLTEMQLLNNKLHGPIPQSISTLVNIRELHLQENNLSGEVKFDLFHKLKNLTHLQLSGNNLSVNTKPITNVTLPKFKLLGLASCNLTEFPDFLHNQDELEFLELSHNEIHGQIPKWFWNLSKETLWHLNLAGNFLTGFDQPPAVLPWTSLRFLGLQDNILQGSLPIPPPSIFTYLVSNNWLTGKISPFICNLTLVIELDLSINNLGGMPPQCLGNLSNSLSVLNLGNNNFRGNIPQTYIEGCILRMIDFSQNQLQGKVPRSLANCTMLETLNLGNNQINDTFPSCLGTLAGLKILILRSNEFHGAIEEPKTTFEFPMLRILDLSNNSFTGKLSSQHFQMWNAMKYFDAERLSYLEANTSFQITNYSWSSHDDFSMTITNKGTEIHYEKIQEFLVAIDLSSNRFEGEIPEDIGNLKALRLLNLSNNFLTGHIPPSFENLTELESLDLSQNKLSGEIPPQLSQLTFLEFLNVSHNRLTGPIPHGKQFDTFENNSFVGNPGLCGNPLSKKCGVSPPPSSTGEEDEGSSSPFEFDWKAVLIGYTCGLVVGVFAGYNVITRKHEWFAMTFGIRQQKMRRVKRRGHGN